MSDSPRKELQLFDALPDEAICSSKIAGIILDLSERTIRYHPHLQRVWTSTGRYGFRVGEVRKLAREGVPLDEYSADEIKQTINGGV